MVLRKSERYVKNNALSFGQVVLKAFNSSDSNVVCMHIGFMVTGTLRPKRSLVSPVLAALQVPF